MKTRRLTLPVVAATSALLLSACEPEAPEPQIDWQPPAFELADALGRNAVTVGQFLQGQLVFLQPAAADDVLAALVELAESLVQQVVLVFLGTGCLQHRIRAIRIAFEISRRRHIGPVVIVRIRRQVEADVMARQAGLHFQHDLGFHAEVPGNGLDLVGAQPTETFL